MPEDKTIQTRFGPIHAHLEGTGPAILLAHGSYPDNSWRVWEHNLEALAQAGFSVYALDLIGYGQSSGQQLGHREQARALVDLMDAERLSSVIAGGVSWGGMIAIELALTFPERVARLILVDSAGAGYYAEEQLESITCPVLIVWGDDDALIPVATAAWFGATFPNCLVELISDVTLQPGAPPWAGHHPMRFKPDEFNRVVTAFLAGRPGKARGKGRRELRPMEAESDGQ